MRLGPVAGACPFDRLNHFHDLDDFESPCGLSRNGRLGIACIFGFGKPACACIASFGIDERVLGCIGFGNRGFYGSKLGFRSIQPLLRRLQFSFGCSNFVRCVQRFVGVHTRLSLLHLWRLYRHSTCTPTTGADSSQYR